jgi:hypothetical protein
VCVCVCKSLLIYGFCLVDNFCLFFFVVVVVVVCVGMCVTICLVSFST